ncbi:MAG: ketoacyl-synthetase C-terminal extension domain-containing protein [Candidatus Binatia bacterium]
MPFAELGLRVPVENVPFPPAELPWVAGVNSFGFGGTNAHIVLTEAPAAEPIEAPPAPSRYVLPISGLRRRPCRRCATYRDWPARQPALRRCTAALRRSRRYRIAVVGETAAELVDALDAPAGAEVRRRRGEDDGDWRSSTWTRPRSGGGWGASCRAGAGVRAVVERCDAAIRGLGG